MKERTIRVICYVVILVCCFVTGISCGIIMNSITEIRNKAAELHEYAQTADYLIAASGDNSLENTDELFQPFWEAWQLIPVTKQQTRITT